MCLLATLLKREGWEVEVITYYPEDFFLSALKEHGIGHKFIDGTGKLKRILKIRGELRKGNQDVILSFLRTPNLLAELSAIPWRKWGLVVSERTGWKRGEENIGRWRSRLHCLADFVTVNSKANRRILTEHARCLKDKIITIYNTVDMDLYCPVQDDSPSDAIVFLVVGRVSQEKNVIGLIEAFGNACQGMPDKSMKMDWYGDAYRESRNTSNDKHSLYRKAEEKIAIMGLQDKVAFHPPTDDIISKYRKASALLLGSFYEGMPNVVCEGMACGKPILMSRVGDAEELVHEEKNGFLFDPYSTEDIAAKMVRFARLSNEEKASMGKYSRMLAEKLFAKDKFLRSYVEVMTKAAKSRRMRN